MCLSDIKDLYFTGASVHPGNGISMVLKSSKICADIINNKWKKPQDNTCDKILRNLKGH